MPQRREWDVTVRGRIETITDRVEFPELFRAALQEEGEISILQFDEPTLPHTTLVVVQVFAHNNHEAERAVRELVLRIYSTIARQFVGDDNFGWTLSTHAVPTTSSHPASLRRGLTRLLRELRRRKRS